MCVCGKDKINERPEYIFLSDFILWSVAVSIPEVHAIYRDLADTEMCSVTYRGYISFVSTFVNKKSMDLIFFYFFLFDGISEMWERSSTTFGK